MSEINPHFSDNQAGMQKTKNPFREEWLLERIGTGCMAAGRLQQRFQGFGLKRFWFYCGGPKASTGDPSIGILAVKCSLESECSARWA